MNPIAASLIVRSFPDTLNMGSSELILFEYMTNKNPDFKESEIERYSDENNYHIEQVRDMIKRLQEFGLIEEKKGRLKAWKITNDGHAFWDVTKPLVEYANKEIEENTMF